MAFKWNDDWNAKGNNNGATQDEIITILKTALKLGTGDEGLREALVKESEEVAIEKGIHPPGQHIRVFYKGGTWHVNLVGTAAGGAAGYRVGNVEQFKNV